MHQLQDNLFEWHFTVRGPADSPFENGYYHGRIILPTEYPMKPPSIILLTPNGRFEVNKKICLSISGHHPESWQPSWSIRTALLAIIGFMPTEGKGAIGSLDYPEEERKILAEKSASWSCESCGNIKVLLKVPSAHQTTEEEQIDKAMQKELARQICFENGPKAETSSKSDSNTENEIRQRKLSNEESTSSDINNEVLEEVVETMNSSDGSFFFSSQFIRILVTAIVLLLIRRLFFMN
jgi:ubiquitin-conjugating enzyme E2 J1